MRGGYLGAVAMGALLVGSPGTNETIDCFLYLRVEGGDFVREHPDLDGFPGAIVVCDCYVDGIEHGTAVPGGYERGRVLSGS